MTMTLTSSRDHFSRSYNRKWENLMFYLAGFKQKHMRGSQLTWRPDENSRVLINNSTQVLNFYHEMFCFTLPW